MGKYKDSEIEVIDLDLDLDSDLDSDADFDSEPGPKGNDTMKKRTPTRKKKKKGIGLDTIFHLFFLLIVVGGIFFIVHRFSNWGTHIDLKEIFGAEDDDPDYNYNEIYDSIMPLTDADGNFVNQDVKRILFFGNSPLSDARDSDNGLANLIASASGAEVINASVSGSYAAAESYNYDVNTAPMDIFDPFWMAVLASTKENKDYFDCAFQEAGSKFPSEAYDVYQMLLNLDLSTVDVICYMYDATDYYMNHQIMDPENPTNPLFYTGNLGAGISYIRERYPNIRFIVMSGTYAYALNADGSYADPEIVMNDHGGLSYYSLLSYSLCTEQLGITFVDNYFGTITEENADKYLMDNIHLNDAGRKLLCDRFMYALDFYKNK